MFWSELSPDLEHSIRVPHTQRNVLDVPLRSGLQWDLILGARQRGVFEGAFSHIVHVAAIEWGQVPVFDMPSQVLIIADRDEPLGPWHLHAEVVVMGDCSELVKGTLA